MPGQTPPYPGLTPRATPVALPAGTAFPTPVSGLTGSGAGQLPLPGWFASTGASTPGAPSPAQLAALQQLSTLAKQIDAAQVKVETTLSKSGGDWSKLSSADKKLCEQTLSQWHQLELKVQAILAPAAGPTPKPVGTTVSAPKPKLSPVPTQQPRSYPTPVSTKK